MIIYEAYEPALNVIICPKLIFVVVQFWDGPGGTCFCFDFQELCPTVEFHAYIGGFDLEEPIISLQGLGFAQFISSKLEMSSNATKSMIHGSVLNIPCIIEKFHSKDFTLCLCFACCIPACAL